MTKYDFGDQDSSNNLIQMVDDHDLAVIENEVSLIREQAGNDFCLTVLKVDNWNDDLSPWSAPAVFGNKAFGNKAPEILDLLLNEMTDYNKIYYIGGYSLSGLFALWAAYQTDIFKGVAAVSPSIWFPCFVEYMKNNEIKTGRVYLSLGDREDKTRNRTMAKVGDCIRDGYEWLDHKGVNTVLEWNQGNHFREPDMRMAKGFAWLLKGSD